MGARTEWAEVPVGTQSFIAPGHFEDERGERNDELAIALSGGVVIMGTAREWFNFAEQLLSIARRSLDEAAAAEVAELRGRVSALEALVPGATYGGL